MISRLRISSFIKNQFTCKLRPNIFIKASSSSSSTHGTDDDSSDKQTQSEKEDKINIINNDQVNKQQNTTQSDILSSLLNFNNKSKFTVQPKLREDWLPADRPWEGPKPEDEILKPHEEPYLYLSYNKPKVSDPKDEKMFEKVGQEAFRTFKYPQFAVKEDPLNYLLLTKEEKRKAYERAQINDHLFQHLPEEYLTPDQSEIVVIGGGIVGATIAYMLKYKAKDSMPIIVLEKDPTYSNAPWTMTHGGFRTQFSLEENILSAKFFYDFLKSAKIHLSILENEPPNINFVPTGFLFLVDLPNAEKRLDFHQKQINQGAYVDVLNDFQLSQKFPWLNTEGIVLGTHGVEGEGWIDPWALFLAIKGRAEFLGVKFMHAEFVDWNVYYPPATEMYHDHFGDCAPEVINRLIYRLPCGAEKQLGFARAIVAAGVDSIDMAKKLGLGRPNTGIRTVPLPVEKRKRFFYVFNCPDAPIIDFPFLVDVPSGVWVRREGLGGNFICGKNPTHEEEPEPSNLDIDYQFFEKLIWPVLVKRVPAFSQLQIVGAWATYIDYNYFDQSPIVGNHPYHPQVYFATGFSGYGMQAAPAVGRALIEEFLYNEHFDVNLTRFNWNRLLFANPVKEEIII